MIYDILELDWSQLCQAKTKLFSSFFLFLFILFSGPRVESVVMYKKVYHLIVGPLEVHEKFIVGGVGCGGEMTIE